MTLRGRSLKVGAGATIIAIVASVAAFSAASATTLGGVTAKSLTAMVVSGTSGAPIVKAWDAFNGTNGSNLNGTSTDDGGKVWAVNPTGGSWTISANQAKSTSSNSSLVIDPGVWNYTAYATVSRGGTTFDGGFTFNRNSAGTQFITCEFTSATNGSLEIWKYDGGWTNWSTAINLYPSGFATAPASADIGCGTTATTAFAKFNGVVVASYTLTAAERATFFRAANQLGGPYQWTVNAMTWDNFHLDVP